MTPERGRQMARLRWAGHQKDTERDLFLKRARNVRYYRKNIEEKRNSARKRSSKHYYAYHNINLEKARVKQKLIRQKDIKTLSDCYVKHQITKRTALKHHEIPFPLIRLKRLQLELYRLCKQQPQKQ